MNPPIKKTFMTKAECTGRKKTRLDFDRPEQRITVAKLMTAAGNVLLSLDDAPSSFLRSWPGPALKRSKQLVQKEDCWREQSREVLSGSCDIDVEKVLRAPDYRCLNKFSCNGFLGAGTFGTVLSAKDKSHRACALKYIAYQPTSIFNAEHEYEFQTRMSELDPPLAFSVDQLINPKVASQPNRLAYWQKKSRGFFMRPTLDILPRLLRDFFSVLVMPRFDGTLDKLFFCLNDDRRIDSVIGDKVLSLLRECAAQQVVHGDLKTNNVGYISHGPSVADVDLRFTDWGKAFDFHVLVGSMHIPSLRSFAYCKDGHILDVLSLAMSCMRLTKRRANASTPTSVDGLIIRLVTYVDQLHSNLQRKASGRTSLGNIVRPASPTEDDSTELFEEENMRQLIEDDRTQSKWDRHYALLQELKKIYDSRVTKSLSSFLAQKQSIGTNELSET